MAIVLKQDEIEAGIKRKGFRQSNRDHRYYILYIDGKKEGATFLSHGKNQDIGPSLLNAMSKELGISTDDFIDFVKCPLSTKDYLQNKKEKLEDRLRILKRG
jgi:hypothetical protein